MRQRESATRLPSRKGGADPLIASGRRPSRQKAQSAVPIFRTFVIGSVLFAAFLALWYTFDIRSVLLANRRVALSVTDVIALEDSVGDLVRRPITVSALSAMIEMKVRIVCAMELVLERLTTTTDSLLSDVSSVSQLSEEEFHRAAAAITSAAAAAYTPLKGILRQESNATLSQVPHHLPRTLFGWMAATIHSYGVVLPEYYLLKDETRHHARSLIRAMNLLSWSTITTPRLFQWTTSVCRHSLAGTTDKWIKFCESSFSTSMATRTRRAAMLEELIALYPTYAPFRLHYVAMLLLREGSFVHVNAALTAIRRDRQGRSKLTDVDRNHGLIMDLLEVYALSVGSVPNSSLGAAIQALQQISNCDTLCRPYTSDTWPGPLFSGEARPDVMDRGQVAMLLSKLRDILPPTDKGVLVQFGNCTA